METLDILSFGAHPDDVEVGMGGTLAKHTENGFRVGICDLTEAEMSSNGTIELRREEAKQAAQVLQLAARDNLSLPDRGLWINKEHIGAVTMTIRKYRPRIVFMPYWEDRHPDHVACYRIVEEAVFNAKLHKYIPELPTHTVEQTFYYFLNDIAPSQVLIDITDVYEKKQQALECYQSQFTKPDESNVFVATPINQHSIGPIVARDALLGRMQGFKYAEGFAVKAPYVISLFL